MPSKQGLSFQSADSPDARQALATYFTGLGQQLANFPGGGDVLELGQLKRDLAEAAVGLGYAEEAWSHARQALNIFLEKGGWGEAVQCCEILYLAEQPASLQALVHGIWLAVTFPVDPQLTINMVQYFIDETPANADGAAVAAIVAHYVVDMRSEGARHESLSFLTTQMLFAVAQRHSGVADQSGFSSWLERLGLLQPETFLPRFSLVLGAVVPPDQWWFERDALLDRDLA